MHALDNVLSPVSGTIWRFVLFGMVVFGAGCSGDAPAEPGATGGGSVPQTSPTTTASPPNVSEREPNAWVGERNDEPFDVKGFLASRAAPSDNAADIYLAAFPAICGGFGDGGKTPLEEEISRLGDIDKLASGAISPQEIDDVLSKASTVLRQIDEAQTKPNCVFVTGLTSDTMLHHAQAVQAATRLSILQLGQAQLRGDFPQAIAALRRSLRLSRDLQPRGHEVCQLVSMASDGLILTAVERLLIPDTRLTVDDVSTLLDLLIAHQQQMLNRVDEGFKMSYMVSRNSIQDIQTGRLTARQVAEFLGVPGATSNGTSTSGPPDLDYETEIGLCNAMYRTAIAAAQEPTYRSPNLIELRRQTQANLAAAADFMKLVAATPAGERTTLRDRLPPTLIIMWAASIEPTINANRRATAHLAAIQMVLALRRYELAHGGLPNNLQAAASDSALQTVPVDPFDGAPLRYATVEGRPTVYSVGSDLKDDGGLRDWEFGKQPGDYLFSFDRLPPTAKPSETPAEEAPSEPPADPFRTWTSTVGTKLEARFIRLDDGTKVVLERKDGRTLEVRLNQLSPADRRWIRDQK